MKRLLLLTALVFVAAAVLYSAEEAKPNLSGKWALDVAKSDFGPMPAPESQTRVVDHQEPSVKITTTSKNQQGERTYEQNITTDGKENTNKFGPVEVKSKSRWDGKTLITEGKAETQNGTFESKETQELSEDGKVLTVKTTYKSSQGEASRKLIFNRQ